ncbi:terminus macrodomain insulation protein YfbV, partial [Salmonella enterica]|uniref:terminus macrodomain insulation protein YfbV n=1 Tax=Salmonella enterica TaxID=28901 RepID=UPI003F1B1181
GLGGLLCPGVATALLFFRLPMQVLWFLVKISVKTLGCSLLYWFYEFLGKLQEACKALEPVEGKPYYHALAYTLKRAFKQLDKTFLD